MGRFSVFPNASACAATHAFSVAREKRERKLAGHFPQEAICTHDDPKRILFGIKGFQNKKAFLTRGMLYLSNYVLS